MSKRSERRAIKKAIKEERRVIHRAYVIAVARRHEAQKNVVKAQVAGEPTEVLEAIYWTENARVTIIGKSFAASVAGQMK